MKNFFLKNGDYKITRHKVATFLLIFLTLFSLLAVPTRPVQAQMVVTDIPN